MPLAAIAILLLNDHILKVASPGALTGKLSDVAGLAFFPLLLVAAAEIGASAAGRPIRRPDRLLTWAIAATALAFTIIKVLPVATAAWAALLGAAQWPFAAILAVASQAPIPNLRAVQAVTDVSDLVALPALLLAWFDGRRRPMIPSRRRYRAAAGGRPGIAPAAALIVAGLASLATTPPSPTPTDVELAIRTDLTQERPVATRIFDLTVDATGIEDLVNSQVSVKGEEEGVRYILTSGDERDRSDRPANRSVRDAAVQLEPCEARLCTQAVTLITELIDPSTAPVTATATLEARVTPRAMDVEIAPERITFVERGGPRFQPAPAVVRGEVNGEETLGPANPIVEHQIVFHREPADVSDAARFLLDGGLRFEAVDGTPSIVVNFGSPQFGQPWGGRALERPVELELPDFGLCGDTEACDVEYVVRFEAGSEMAEPSTIRWRIALEMRDYATVMAPDDRMITAELRDSIAVAASPVVLRQTIRGGYLATGLDPPKVKYHISVDPAITTLPDGTPRRLLVAHVMTVRSVELKLPGHKGQSVQLRLGSASYEGGDFVVDGRAHTFRRYDLAQCDVECQNGLDFDFDAVVRSDPALPVWLDWTLEIQLTAWGDPALPVDGHMEVRTVQPPDGPGG